MTDNRKPRRARRRRVPVLLAALLFLSCAPREQELILASTTSTQDSGLLDVLIPAFQSAHAGVKVKVIAVGSGEALALGRRGDADVLLVHSPAEEIVFMNDGYGLRRRSVMYNDFVIVGPASDPAQVRGSSSAADALRRIAGSGATFISRGDSSGTHRKELLLWKSAGVLPREGSHLDVGQGMGETLMITSERTGYTLSDRGTFLARGATLDLRIVFEGDAALRNPYTVIEVSHARNSDAAEAFAQWITSAAARTLIAEFGVETFGEPLFFPASD
jgi:tungstate transport system substrate-binding protein